MYPCDKLKLINNVTKMPRTDGVRAMPADNDLQCKIGSTSFKLKLGF